MSVATILSVFALLSITCVQEARAQAGRVCIRRMTGNVVENQGPVVFQLWRKLGSSGNVTVNYTISDITTEPEDLLGPRSGSVTFTDGQLKENITVPINDDMLEEDSEQFDVTLTGQTGSETRANAIIFDDDLYSPWSEWSGACGVTCGPANKTETRTRNCTATIPPRCRPELMNQSRVVDCGLPGCPVLTPWSQWADNGTCSTTCGNGTLMQFRERNCTANCVPNLTLTETRTVSCEICTCPNISQWTEWADNGTCSTTCGNGTQMQLRTRSCTDSTCCPDDFTTTETRTMMCQICTCPNISQWTEWADNGTCSTTCGNGTQMQSRTRSCTDSLCCPDDFTTTETRTMMCQICTCPNISQWTEWADNGTCSTTCGDGTKMQSRTRTCTDSTCCPDDFTTTETRTMMCQICTCPVIGPWCPWANSGPCSVTCGCGTQMQARHRVCINTCTPPDCVTREERTVNCSHKPCHPTSWNSWSATGWSTWNRWTQWPTGNRGSQWSTWYRRTRWPTSNGGSQWSRWNGGSQWSAWNGGSRWSTWNRRSQWSTRNRRSQWSAWNGGSRWSTGNGRPRWSGWNRYPGYRRYGK